MFPKRHVKLNLPNLKKIDEVEVKHNENPFKGSLFKLEWNKIEKENFSRFESLLNSWKVFNHNEINDKFPGFTSDINYKFTENMRFLISNDYLSQIKNHILQAYNNLCIINLPDTMIREYCMKPSHMHIQVAFFLLADCLFDKKTSYFDRNYNLTMVTSSLLWRYWSFNTGRGLLRKKCLINKLEYQFIDNKDEFKIKDYVNDFDSWLDKLVKAYDVIYMSDENNEGPSKGD